VLAGAGDANGQKKRISPGLNRLQRASWDRVFELSGNLKASGFIRRTTGVRAVAGKRVLVIGGGTSACDRRRSTRVGKTSRLSVRQRLVVLPKTFFGIPSAEMNEDLFLGVGATADERVCFCAVTVGKLSQ